MDWTIKLEARTGWGDVETIEVGRLHCRVEQRGGRSRGADHGPAVRAGVEEALREG